MLTYFIGADIGTGSAKAVAIDAKRNVLTMAQSFYPVISRRLGYAEQKPEAIWNAFAGCIKEVVAKSGGAPVCISISSAMHSIMAVDKNNEPLMNFLTWEDTRSDAIAEKLRNSVKGKSIYEATGTPIHSMSPLCKIRWIKENQPSIFKKSFKFISIKEFLWFRLFHEYEVDYSIASATGLFNIKKPEWYLPSLSFCRIALSQLSKPVPTTFIRSNIISSIAKKLHITTATKFCIGASDGCLANIGSYATNKGIGALTIGTSGAVRIATRKPVSNYESMIFNYILDEKFFISGGPVNNGGNVMKWMFKTFLNNSTPSDDDYKKVFQQVQQIDAGAEGLIFLPYLYGERAPIWDEKASGTFIGAQSFHTTYHFFRAAIEGICFSLKNILDDLEVASGKITQLNVSGGFVHSQIWMQVLANITGKKICKILTADASCMGAALLSMKAFKYITQYRTTNIKPDVIIHPQKKQVQLYKTYYVVFKNTYPVLKSTMHALNELR